MVRAETMANVNKTSLAISKILSRLRSVIAHRPKFLRWTIVQLTISAWLLASNHCALAGEIGHHAVKPAHVDATGAGHGHCPGPSQEKDGDESEMLCCSSLQATFAQPAKSFTAFDQVSFVSVAYFLLPFVLLERQASAISTELDTGPPYSFAENVIQRCLPSNAPPSLS